jgi:glycosyltransferase involved in cell wall biosynthesis
MNEKNPQARVKVTWLTNLPAPYRVGVWDQIQKSQDLTVWFLLSEDNWRKWSINQVQNWSFSYLNKKSIRYGEIDLVLSAIGNQRVLQNTELLIVGGWESPFFIQVMRNAIKANIPVIQFYESTLQSHRFNGRTIRYIRQKIFSYADYVVTVGPASTEAVLDMGVDPKKILTLFNPVDVSWFADFAASHRIPSSLGHRFLYVGQLIERKNVAALISAFADMHQEGDSLTIVGDGPLANELKRQVSALHLENSIIFTGHHSQEQVALDYAAADTFILPSTNEVWGLVVNEALASGLHVVVSRAAGVAEFVAPMKGAFIANPTTISLKESLIQSRATWSGPISNPEIMEYTPERFADAVVGLVEGVVEKKARPQLTWVTNIPAPYRLPIWHELNKKTDFSLIFFNKTEHGRMWDLSHALSGLVTRNLNIKAVHPDKKTPLYLNWFKVRREMAKHKAKSIYLDGYESPAFFLTAWWAKQNDIKVIFGYRSTLQSHRFNGRTIRYIRQKIFSYADYVVTVGPASTEAVLDMGVDPKKILTLFNPVDVSWFADFAASHRIPSSLGHRFLYVGQLIERKNVAALISAFADMHQEGDSLTIVGDGPLANELKRQVSALHLENSIIFTGHHSQEQVALDYAAADTFILPSTNEVWGLVVNEALASGLHVVVSRAAGVAEFVAPMKGAFIANPTTISLKESLIQSRATWSGPISNPEIMEYTPERFADAVVGLVENFSKSEIPD